ncbi:uncharacterized protein TNCT_268951 [Trichonephila clavata]|uniref:Uncharacterized protein n=1 Tax=Trichonephila clavata TaxID=2740835 RepID=A0A8X6H2E2_TRICU|nr:uncharacterized protein TNCT_268951 [Trichonephila clavata]
MKFLNINSDIIQLEEGVRNAFRWNWIERRNGNGDTIGTWCKKINVAGQAYCVFCNSLLKYGGEGFKAFTNHSKTVTHIKYSKCIRHSMTLSNYANSKNTDDLLETDARPLDIVTRKAHQEVLITSFIAENSLSFNVAPNLIELCKQLSRDQTALNSLEMSRTTACYKMKYKLAKTIKENIIKTLKETPFSLNLDESTSNAEESILAILVQFYDNNQNEVVVHHFAFLKMESCNSEAVFKAVVNTIEDNNIPWANLISVLMDSCNTMHGKKKGVETRLRSNKAPHLLDTDGDTCHTANNCAKKCASCFDRYLEDLFDDIYFDMKSCSTREKFFKICESLAIKKLKPLKRPDHRWVYILCVLERIKDLWDALIAFYFHYLDKTDKGDYFSYVETVYNKRNISAAQKKIVKGVYFCLHSQQLTKDALAQKKRILNSKVIFTGAEASTLLKKLSKNHPIAKELQISTMKAYTNTAQHMKQKLPLKNLYLISFTALDPELRGKASTILAFEKLSSFMSHIFSDNEKSKVEAEIRLYQSDIDITKEMLYTSDESGNQVKCTIDKYWSKVFNLKDDFTNDYKYPTLAKLVKACLSCFHGPLVESAFNLMDTLVTDYRTSLKIDSLDAVQTIKYDLMASKETSCEKYGSKNPMTDPIHKDLLLNMNRSWKTYQEDLKTCISDESPIKVSEKPSTLAEKQTASTSACAVLEEISSTVNEENKSQPSCNYEVHHKRKTSPQTSENKKKKQQKLDNFFFKELIQLLKSTLSKLDVTQTISFRLITAATESTPLKPMELLTNIEHLSDRHLKSALLI